MLVMLTGPLLIVKKSSGLHNGKKTGVRKRVRKGGTTHGNDVDETKPGRPTLLGSGRDVRSYTPGDRGGREF